MRNFIAITILGFFIGVALRSFFAFSMESLFMLFVLAVIFGIIFYFRRESGVVFIQLAFILVGLALGTLRYEMKDSRENLYALQMLAGRKIEISGEIIEDPQKLEKFTRAVLKTGESAKILLTLPHFPEVKYGDRLEISGTLGEPENFSEFDWKGYLAKDNIYFEMFLPEIVSREEGGGLWLKKYLFSAKHAFIKNLARVLPEPHSSFLAGLTIGERTSLQEELEESFRQVGVIHIIALSGYNITIISENALKIINFIPVAKIFRTVIATFLVILFAILTGGSATVVRASIMGILILWARESGKVYQALTTLIFAGFIMVAINPKILRFDASFQLSFLATAGLIFLAPGLEKYFRRVPNFWRIRENLVATLSAQIFVLPLLLHLGGNFSWVTIPANLLILSAIPVTMFFGFLAGLSGFFSHYLSLFLSFPAYWLLSYELWIVKIFSGF